jgi:hypothetical protein
VPVAGITGPPDGHTAGRFEPVEFTGFGQDPDEGFLPDSLLSWSSSHDGVLGTGGRITVDTLSVNTHVITLTATDSRGHSGRDSITVDITP